MEKKSPNIADTELGFGGTTQWKLCGLDSDTSYGVVFEITANNKWVPASGVVGWRCPR